MFKFFKKESVEKPASPEPEKTSEQPETKADAPFRIYVGDKLVYEGQSGDLKVETKGSKASAHEVTSIGGSYSYSRVVINGRVISSNMSGDESGNSPVVNVRVEGDVQGDVEGFVSVECNNVGGDVRAGTGVTVSGEVKGNVRAGTDVSCGNVGGEVHAGTEVKCGAVTGDVRAGMSVVCETVGGSVKAGMGVTMRK